MTKVSAKILFIVALWICTAQEIASFSTSNSVTTFSTRFQQNALYSTVDGIKGSDDWQGDIVSGGTIKGCSVTQAGDSVTEWIIRIDGVDADLGRFSEAIYKQIMNDAKRQSFQGFRPGTIPPHLLNTYRGFAMDECARETVLEAMQQNNIRPFTTAREEFRFEQVSIPPPKTKGKKKKNNNKKKNKKAFGGESDEAVVEAEVVPEEKPAEPQWQVFETLDQAIKGGWAPGQSFSFVATNVKGQKVLSDNQTQGATALGTPIKR